MAESKSRHLRRKHGVHERLKQETVLAKAGKVGQGREMETTERGRQDEPNVQTAHGAAWGRQEKAGLTTQSGQCG
eukprot:6211919-Pleurochrysis_carterae.AAC.3